VSQNKYVIKYWISTKISIEINTKDEKNMNPRDANSNAFMHKVLIK